MEGYRVGLENPFVAKETARRARNGEEMGVPAASMLLLYLG